MQDYWAFLAQPFPHDRRSVPAHFQVCIAVFVAKPPLAISFNAGNKRQTGLTFFPFHARLMLRYLDVQQIRQHPITLILLG